MSQQPVRLYSRGVIAGYRRGGANSGIHRNHTSILKIEGVKTLVDSRYYLGKRVAYVYKGKKKVRGTRFRVIWGKVVNTHGNSGAVRAKFSTPLPPNSLGGPIRVMMYPSRI